MNKKKFTYQLEKGSRKFRCPKCDKKTFVRFINMSDNSYAPEAFGRCDRESKCGYFEAPYFENDKSYKASYSNVAHQVKSEQIHIPNTVLHGTLKSFNINTFVQYLVNDMPYPMPGEMVMEVINKYKVGTISKGFMMGGLTLPFIAKNGKVHAIQVKLFDKDNHTIKTNFLHSIMANYYKFNNLPKPLWLDAYMKNDKIVRCLFGEHLLNAYPSNPIALVEAPKTALYASLYFGLPECKSDFLWLAVFNKSSLSYEKLKVLDGRTIVLFPDLNAYDDWNTKIQKMKSNLKGTQLSVSDYLEHNSDEEDKKRGLDLGDYLVKYDWRELRLQKKKKEPKISIPKLKMKAYIDTNGQLYLKQPFMDEYTLYPSINSFKYRKSLPCFVSSSIFELNKCREIDLNEFLK